jgi:sulfur carrier protein ThiS
MTINVKIEIGLGLKNPRNEHRFEMDLSDDATVKTMLMEIGYEEKEIDHLRVSINNKLVPKEKRLKDGDDIFVWAPISGGKNGVNQLPARNITSGNNCK